MESGNHLVDGDDGSHPFSPYKKNGHAKRSGKSIPCGFCHQGLIGGSPCNECNGTGKISISRAKVSHSDISEQKADERRADR